MHYLKQPIRINQLELANRLVLPPMATAKSGESGEVTQQLCDYYAEKSAGGYVGCIITEHSYVSPEGKASPGQLSIAEDSCVEGLRKIVQAVHQNGSKVFAQISHAGGAASTEVTGCAVYCPSSVQFAKPTANGVQFYPEGETHKELCVFAQEELHILVQKFADAARRAKEAGFDGVEIHSAHGYLLDQFYSPLTNRREDAYTGKTLEGRIRLHLEIIAAVRAAVGAEYPVALRLGACDYMEGGSTLQDSIAAAKAFERAGVDLLDISGGFCSYIRPGHGNEQGYFAELTEAIKKEISIPVILTGGITRPEAAEQLLEEQKADLIGVGRAMLKDSLWAQKAMTE